MLQNVTSPLLGGDLVFAEHDVDDDIDIAHIDRVIIIDVASTFIILSLIPAKHYIDEDVDIRHIYCAVDVDISKLWLDKKCLSIDLAPYRSIVAYHP